MNSSTISLRNSWEEQPGVHFPWHDDPLFNNRIELLKIPGVGYRIGTYTTLLHILRNKVYKGTWVTGGKEYPNNHEAIVDPATWDTANYLLDKRHENPKPRNRSHVSMLKGLIVRPFPGCIVTVSPVQGEISFAWKEGVNKMHPNRRDIIPLKTVEEMFQEIFTRRLLTDDKCYDYAQAASALYAAEAKDKEHVQETITGLEARRHAILDDLENPQRRKKMSGRTVDEKYAKVADIEGEIARLQAVVNRPSKYIPLPDLLSLIEQLRRDWNSLDPKTIRNVAMVFCKGIVLKPLSNHLWGFTVQWELWNKDTGLIWLNVGDKYHWTPEDIATLKALVARRATTEEFLTTLPKFSQTAISNMCVRKCGVRAIPKGSHRVDAYLTRQDMHILTEYGISIDQIALLKGAVRAKEFSGEEYWSLAYTKREDCQDAIFFVDRDDGDNSAVIK